MTDSIKTLASAANLAASAAADICDALADGEVRPISNVASGETLTALADSLRLLIDATASDEPEANQLHGALLRFLEDRV